MNVHYCDCHNGCDAPLERPIQLWRAGLWPASFSRPQTVFTIHTFGFFTQLTFQAKTTAHDFYGTLRRLTSNAFFDDVKDRYREFLMSHRQYTYLETLKRFAAEVKRKPDPGSLALRCPACPQPDINMDPHWKDRPQQDRYKDALHYGKDGNFTLHQHDKKMDPLDFPLMNGGAYYVDSEKYQEYLEKMKVYEDAQDETANCSNFNALSDRYKGKIKTGQVSLSCTRHGYVLPCGTVDLHIGERYANVDYATLCGLQWFTSLSLWISSYDVNCKYGINWWHRIKQIASTLPSVPGVTLAKELWPVIRRCVPKFHMPSHTGICKYLFSFYYMPGVGNTDGEAVERRWAAQNAIGRSVREMGPGHRQDVLDAHNSDFNAQKMFKIGRSLQGKLKLADKYYGKNRAQLDGLEKTLTTNRRPLDEWRRDEAAYIAQMTDPNFDGTKVKNPYQPAVDEVPTIQDILARLKREETSARQKPMPNAGTKRKASALDTTGIEETVRGGLGDMLVAGFELEQEQEAFKAKVVAYEKEPSSDKYNSIAKERSKLERRLVDWLLWQQRVMGPSLLMVEADVQAEWPSIDSVAAEQATVLVPSAYSQEIRRHASLERFVVAEQELRVAHANDTLKKIRQKLHFEAYYRGQNAGSFGQQAQTRYSKLKTGEREKIEALRKEYERARLKVDRLATRDRPNTLRPLLVEQCRPPVVAKENVGRQKESVSWIWRDGTYHDTALDKWALEACRLEWFRASARTTRWNEEVEIVKEEMRRVQRFFHYCMKKWEERAEVVCTNLDEQGAAAFAARQSSMYSRLLTDAQKCFPLSLQIIFDDMVAPLEVSMIDGEDGDTAAVELAELNAGEVDDEESMYE
ncbi:uncharacterized protein B0H18DRAFT_1001893 [Fomitopsis serialis]|uniref:uncharacterized protein n=1 Tax=Fomitopsis serialis TaxID=139415 RepID=UPI002008C6D8|nr:uncharacterized protein B0H18DRAFT_1026651 [Neoantrodia serialis]XP_047894360.1 uncharacterized protein B0H18DRAFT_1001893 [Neoantrodia serialis]KAH9919675.1 hypothetical protein B0H18DRAFT_1026651 [Neoantrodia serialis]KAH9927717.1 hypothetical protein B0H18DRAFT_1001893 [Neoantrodia serialis]